MYIDIDSVKIAWQPPVDDGGIDVTGYVVDYKEYGQDIWSPVTSLAAKTSITVNCIHKIRLN